MPALKKTKRAVLAVSLAALTACAVQERGGDQLFHDLGGMDGIGRITDAFLFQLAENEAVLPLFLNTDIERFREQFRTQVCDVAGGPCVYSGDSMRDTHRGMGITRAQFNSVVEDLIDAMESAGTPTAAQNALLQRLALLYPEITGP